MKKQFEEEHNTTDINEEEHDNSHHNEYDPHIWLNPQNAIGMVKNIEEELCNIDPQNKEYYQQNAENYIKQLTNLDNEIETTIKESKKNKIAFGGTFAYAYFIQRYNLQYVSAYDSCGENSEAKCNKSKRSYRLHERKQHKCNFLSRSYQQEKLQTQYQKKQEQQNLYFTQYTMHHKKK